MFRLSFFPFHWFSLLLAINGIVPGFSQKDCGDTDVEKCNGIIEQVIQNPNIAFAESEEDLDVACRYFRQFVDCITNLADRCYKAPEKDIYLAAFSGIISFIPDMCDPGSSYRTEFLKHSSCFRGVENDLQKCVETYQSEADALKGENLSAEETMKKTCCYIDGATDCLVTPTTKKCGKSAADLLRQASRKIYGPLTFICSGIEYDSAVCSSASSTTISVFLLVVFIFILSFKHQNYA